MKKAIVVWTLLNLIWWILDIGLGYGIGIDLVPGIDNSGEFVISILIYGAGLIYVMSTKDSKTSAEDMPAEDDKVKV